MNISKGKYIGIVGRSGGGKSTLIKILLGLNTPPDGTVLINGIDLNSLKKEDIRKQISYISQEPFLFNASLNYNLSFGIGKKFSDEELMAACEKVHLSTFVEGLPQGLNTIVGDRGILLSGGQRQRIALARAILKDSKFFILDEATSALDNETEALIQDTIESGRNDRTIIAIAHRLSTLKNADIIYVLDQGRVVESGNYKNVRYIEKLSNFQVEVNSE